MFLNCSTCFGRHTAHHQELKNGNCSLWFYIRFWLPKPEAAITVFVLLMMGGVSPETCWAVKKHGNNKFHYTVVSCLFFLWDSVLKLWLLRRAFCIQPARRKARRKRRRGGRGGQEAKSEGGGGFREEIIKSTFILHKFLSYMYIGFVICVEFSISWRSYYRSTDSFKC